MGRRLTLAQRRDRLPESYRALQRFADYIGVSRATAMRWFSAEADGQLAEFKRETLVEAMENQEELAKAERRVRRREGRRR